MFKCKFCQYSVQKRKLLLTHYRLDHLHRNNTASWPCLYTDCQYSFTSCSSLRSHLRRFHSSIPSNSICEIQCAKCETRFLELDLFLKHLRSHVALSDMIECPFKCSNGPCPFRSNISSTFRSHLTRHHCNSSVPDLNDTLLLNNIRLGIENNEDLLDTTLSQETAPDSDSEDGDANEEFSSSSAEFNDNFEERLLNFLAMLFVKMQSILHVPVAAIQEIVNDINELHLLAKPVLVEILSNSLHKYNIPQHEIDSLISKLHESYPFYAHTRISKGEPLQSLLGSQKLRHNFAVENMPFICPKETDLGKIDGIKHSSIYVSILTTLQALLNRIDVLNVVLNSSISPTNVYQSFNDGFLFRQHPLFFENSNYLKIALYCDEFETANPLGTNRKKHKIYAFYWTLLNIPIEYRSALHVIQLAILCKSEDARNDKIGLEKILTPLLQDLSLLEDVGIFVEKLGVSVKGTLVYVCSDNLGSHNIGGFVENFSRSSHLCRYCLATKFDMHDDSKDVDSFPRRTRQNYTRCVQQVKVRKKAVKGIVRDSPLHGCLQFFHICSGLPPDVAHDLLEGIVPYELAIGLSSLIAKGYFTEKYLRDKMNKFEYKLGDKVNRPILAYGFVRKKSIGGNMSKNWTFIRLLPLFIGEKVPENDCVWQVLMLLKDIVELSLSSAFTEESIEFLSSKIHDHRQLFREAFPNHKLKPKHHFLEHYPQQIRMFGPLVACWTIRFEAKHNYFKQVVHRCKNFKNLLKTLAVRHQLMQGYFLASTSYLKDSFTAGKVNTVTLDSILVCKRTALENKLSADLFRSCRFIDRLDSCELYGISYSPGMIVAYSFSSGLPVFAEVHDIFCIHGVPYFIVKSFLCCYLDHYRCFELFNPNENFLCITKDNLEDYYPLPSYVFDNRCLVIPKHFICDKSTV